MFLLIVACVLFVIYFFKQIKRPPNFPPGPTWLPIIGNLPELKKLSKELGGQHLALTELAKKYNTNVLGLKLGKDYVITVFSYRIIKAVLCGEEYDGRPDNFFIRLRSMGTRKGVTCTDGEFWRVQRSFVVTHLRSLGFGKKPMELLIKEEISEVLKNLEQNGNGVQIGEFLAPAIISILWALLAGKRINRSDPCLLRLLGLLRLRSKVFDISGGSLTHHPWLRFIAPEKTGYNLLQRWNAEWKHFMMETINEHYKNWYADRNDDLIYSFISEMKKKSEHSTDFTDEQLVMVCLDIFIAGSNTTSNTIDFAFLMMILHPDIQMKVQKCLDEALDPNSVIEYSHRQKVPYVQAVLLEVERYYPVTPIIGPRRVLRDTVLEGYLIPKETTVLISLLSVHNDKTFWKDPEVFRPDRFLDDDGQLLSLAQERVFPFGLGRRRCLGEVLARNCIFIFFAEIIRKYSISVEPGSPTPTGIPVPGITLSPERYNAKFTPRKK